MKPQQQIKSEQHRRGVSHFGLTRYSVSSHLEPDDVPAKLTEQEALQMSEFQSPEYQT